MPEQVKSTLDADLASTEIHWNDPGRGLRLRRAYYAQHGLEPPAFKMPSRQAVEAALRRIDDLIRAEEHRSMLGDLMHALLDRGRLDGFKTRRGEVCFVG